MIEFLSSVINTLSFAAFFILGVSIGNAEQISADLDTLATIVKTFIRPVLNTTQKQTLQNVYNNAQDSVIKIGTKQKIELPPVLDKYTSSKNQITEDSEETIILEAPNSSETKPKATKGKSKSRRMTNDSSFSKYKQLRQKIGKILRNERMSNKTKVFIIEAFDKMMFRMNRCNRQKRLRPNTSCNLGGSDREVQKKLRNLWKQQFNELTKGYCKYNDDLTDMTGSKDNSEFLASVRELLFEVHNDFRNIIAQNNLKCSAFGEQNIGRINARPPKKFAVIHNVNNLTLDEDITRQKSRPDVCDFYSVCTDKLQEFLKDFYIDLREAVDRVLSNYIDMYLLDQSNEISSNHSLFVSNIKDINEKVKKKFNETFSKETDKMNLDSSSDIKVKVEDVKILIDEIVMHIKKLINDVITDKANAIPDDIRYTVIEDIMTSSDIELSDILEKFSEKMCSFFQTCQDKNIRRMHDRINRVHDESLDFKIKIRSL